MSATDPYVYPQWKHHVRQEIKNLRQIVGLLSRNEQLLGFKDYAELIDQKLCGIEDIITIEGK